MLVWLGLCVVWIDNYVQKVSNPMCYFLKGYLHCDGVHVCASSGLFSGKILLDFLLHTVHKEALASPSPIVGITFPFHSLTEVCKVPEGFVFGQSWIFFSIDNRKLENWQNFHQIDWLLPWAVPFIVHFQKKCINLNSSIFHSIQLLRDFPGPSFVWFGWRKRYHILHAWMLAW